MRRVLRVGLAVAMGLPMLAACNRDAVARGEARLEPNGTVEVATKGTSFERVTKATTIKDGSRVRVLNGTADLRLPAGELALRSGSEIVIGPSPELVAGDLLVVPERSLTVESAGSHFAVRGAARMNRTFAVTVASYSDGVAIRSAGSTLDVGALRQASIAALGQAPQRAEPMRYAATDAWDRRFLADAIDLGLELDARSESATAQFRGQGTTAGFYRTLMPELDGVGEFTTDLLDAARPPGEHIVGAGIALAGTEQTFTERWRAAFAFRGEGASWGLVALDQRVHRVPGLMKRIDEALGRSQLPGDERRVAQRTAPTTTASSDPTTTTTTPTTVRRPGRTTTTPTTTTTTTTTTTVLAPGLPILDGNVDVSDTVGGLLPEV